jgi:hypothetical protein
MKFTLHHWTPDDDSFLASGPSALAQKLLVKDESGEVVAYWQRERFRRTRPLRTTMKRDPDLKPRRYSDTEFFSETYSEQDLLDAIGIGPTEIERASAVRDGGTFLDVALKARNGGRAWMGEIEMAEVNRIQAQNSALEFEV